MGSGGEVVNCSECRWAEWDEETEAGTCRPVPHLPPADIIPTLPACFFFDVEPATDEAEPTEADAVAEVMGQPWGRGGR